MFVKVSTKAGAGWLKAECLAALLERTESVG